MELAHTLQIDSENTVIGDMRLVNGQPFFTNDLTYEVAIRLYNRFLFFKGSWFLDLRQGRSIFYEKNTPDDVIRSEIAQTITGTVGVRNLTELRLERLPNRELSVVFSVELEDGSTFASTEYPPFVIQGGV